MVPGNLPYFLFATNPRSKSEAIELLKITQNTLREIWNESNAKKFETAKEFSAVNWLDEQGNPNEKLSKFLNHFATKPNAKDNLNNFAVTYPIFRGFQSLTIKQLQNPDCSLLSLPDYDKKPNAKFGLFHINSEEPEAEWVTEDEIGDSGDEFFTESDSVAINLEQMYMDNPSDGKVTTKSCQTDQNVQKVKIAGKVSVKSKTKPTQPAKKSIPSLLTLKLPEPDYRPSTKPKSPVLEATTPGAKSLWEENQYLKQKLAETTADLHKFKQLYAELLLKTGEDATKQPKSIRLPPSINSIGESVNGKSAVGQHSSCASAVLPDDFQELYAKDPIERATKIPGCKCKSQITVPRASWSASIKKITHLKFYQSSIDV